MSKGSSRRPILVPRDTFNERWDAIFRPRPSKRRRRTILMPPWLDNADGEPRNSSPKHERELSSEEA